MTNQANDDEAGTGATAMPVREKISQAVDTAKDKTVTAYSSARAKATETLDSAREQAAVAARRTSEQIRENPVAALVGGLALGAIAGVLIPSTRKESELLRPLGSKVGEAAKVAAKAAREAGQDTLVELGLNRDSAREQVSKIVDSALKVAGEAGTAAARAVRQGPA